MDCMFTASHFLESGESGIDEMAWGACRGFADVTFPFL